MRRLNVAPLCGTVPSPDNTEEGIQPQKGGFIVQKFSQEEISDIKTAYRDAKDPEKQIGILAQLYLAPEKDIRAVLQLPEEKKMRRRQYHEDFKRALAAEASKPGAVLSEVAKAHNVAQSLVSNWRKKYTPAEPAPFAPPAPLPVAQDADILHEVEKAHRLFLAAKEQLEQYVPLTQGESLNAGNYLLRAQGFVEGVAYMTKIYHEGGTVDGQT